MKRKNSQRKMTKMDKTQSLLMRMQNLSLMESPIPPTEMKKRRNPMPMERRAIFLMTLNLKN